MFLHLFIDCTYMQDYRITGLNWSQVLFGLSLKGFMFRSHQDIPVAHWLRRHLILAVDL